MAKEEKEIKEAIQFIRALKDIRGLMQKDIKATLYVDEFGIFLTSVHALRSYEEGDEAGEEEYHFSFSESRKEEVKKQSMQLDYLG